MKELPAGHKEYREKMVAWFKEQEAVIESDKIDMAHAESNAEQFAKKASLYRVMATSNKEQLAADEARLRIVKEQYEQYLKDFEDEAGRQEG